VTASSYCDALRLQRPERRAFTGCVAGPRPGRGRMDGIVDCMALAVLRPIAASRGRVLPRDWFRLFPSPEVDIITALADDSAG
jgi:hypothetical protein